MKKMSLGLYGIGMALLLTSCVAKKKYVEAQGKISQLEQQNANCLARTDSLNNNIASLQQSNSELQGRYDSSMRAYTTQQTRVNDYTGFYDKQKTSADQMHTTLHQQLDEKIGAANIVLHNNKVFITLPEATLFNSGSTSLSTKGKDIIGTLATNIAQNPDVEVYVATSATDPVTGAAWAEATMDNTSVAANETSSSYDANATKTYKKPATVKKSSGTKSTAKVKSESTKKTMKSNYAKKKTKPGVSSSSMAVARASTIVSTLRQQGVQKAGIQVTDPVNRTSTSARKYQVIVSPSMEGYHQMMGKNDLGTGMK